jgi:hypothetical protein
LDEQADFVFCEDLAVILPHLQPRSNMVDSVQPSLLERYQRLLEISMTWRQLGLNDLLNRIARRQRA